MRFLILIPILAAFAFLEVFLGGARLLYGVSGVALVALASLFTALPGTKTSQRVDIPALAASLLFAAYIVLRNRFSEVEYIGRLQLFILIGSLMVYLLFTLVLTRPLDRKRLFVFLGILALLQMIPAIVQFTQGNQWMPFPWSQRQDHSWRASGLFISPNNFAGFVEIIALFAASFTIWGRMKILTRVLLGYIALVCIVGVAISGSRGGYLSLVFGSGVLLLLTLIAWHRMKREHFRVAAIVSVIAALVLFAGILLVVFLSPNLGGRVMQINDPENPRLILWPAALHQFQLSPIWGTGGFSYLYYGRMFRDPSVQLDPIHVHNDYLQLLADYGIVGFFLFFLFLALHLRAGMAGFGKLATPSSSRSSSLQSDRLALSIGALSAIGAYMVHSVVDFNMQLPLNALMMAAVLAILANYGAPFEETATREKGEIFRKLVRYALPLLALAALFYGVPMIPGEYQAYQSRSALVDGHPREALDAARQGTLKTHDNPELYFYRGEAAMQLAAQPVQKGETNTVDPKALYLEAASSFASGLKVFPYDSRLALKLAQAQAAVGDYFSAIGSVDYAEKLDPNSGFVPAYRAIIDYSFGYFEDARVDCNQSLDMGGQGADIAQQVMTLIDKQQSEEDQQEESSPTESENKPDSNEPTPATDETESGSTLMKALPAAAATPHPGETKH